MLAENVVKIGQNEIYDQIELFLEKKKMKSGSEKTKEAYYIDIRDFFRYLTKGQKDLGFLSIEDIQLGLDDIVNYQLYLKHQKGLINKSINRKLSTISQLYARFQMRGMVKDLSAFDEADRLKEGKNHHGVLTVNEVFQMADLVLNQKRGRKRLTKYYLLLLALDSCLRKSALLNLTWDDFLIINNDEVEIRAIDKGNEERNLRISREFYEELQQLKNESSTNKVFNISETSIQEMMNYLNKKMNFEKKRNIVFHSIRKCGVTFQYRISGGDLLHARKASGHKSLANLQLYLGETDLNVLGAVSSTKNKLDDELFMKVSHEELIEGIKKLNKDQILLLNIKLNEIRSKQ
ncbi:tyrosine-type recombinase/integrase [Robertmurraya siralis]|uniref:tyrosine-type recombinase/integrase n=1 Tax=Robertmurraya siralis TaxID=77777 RepID=UPI0014775B75|nr:site-specific integrase [Robertmurraya siralis]